MQLDHATIVTDQLDSTCRFLAEVVGLTRGARPPFAVDGGWFYAAGRPVIHVVRATVAATAARSVPRIDHVALRIEDRDEWHALVERLDHRGIGYQLSEVPLSNELQLFVALAPGVAFEFVTALGPAAH
ncbi:MULTISPECIES: VOC family protein [Burkholderia]|uniref:VOC family protein n=1 Tax=Burkholderia TaxID=32008 RepID=UPI0014219F9C|nr:MULTISPECIES: VOC family protein [Burkholderia]NIE84824.1 extradiol dioxygenase [Burkholderia sp. Tr-860]NIF62788.1 extradiol dioxygenase [Burkholderia sp. Cy-647]NIF95585.1 extradiol dioxygenase [Burkholderia sp. Ax-1720]